MAIAPTTCCRILRASWNEWYWREREREGGRAGGREGGRKEGGKECNNWVISARGLKGNMVLAKWYSG